VSAESYLTSWEIRERTGATRLSLALYGRALPLKDQSLLFGVLPKAERTLDRGARTKRTEALGVDWEPLVITGHWKQNFFRTGDARAEVSPRRAIETPQQLCDFVETFASRQKELDVIWSGGVARVCDWAGFQYSPTIGPDRRWTMRFEVLGRGDRPELVSDSPLNGRSSLAGLSAAHLDLDRALSDIPAGLNPSFIDSLRSVTDTARLGLARARQAIHRVGDLARAPADALRELNNVAAAARDTMLEIDSVFEDTAYEYQVQVSRSEDLLQTRRWQSDVRRSVDTGIDQILALLDAVDARLRNADTYVPVLPGESLVRVAQRVYGASSGPSWRTIADANGITGQLVPPGVTQLVIPPRGS